MGTLEFDVSALAWTHVCARFAAAQNWWVGTNGPAALHAVPVWGVVIDETLHFYGERSTVRSRNLSADPRIVLHLPDPLDVVVVQGSAHPIGMARDNARACAAYAAKYVDPDVQRWLPDAPGMNSELWAVTPSSAIAYVPTDSDTWPLRRWRAAEPVSSHEDIGQ